VRVSARLIRADRDDQQVWTRTYERDLKSILALQREVAHAVASEIGIRFRSESPATAANVDPQAYRAYLLGLQYSNDFPARAGAAMDQFERAINMDPKFASAYAALARSYANGGAGRSKSRHEIRQRAVQLAGKALALDNNNAEAHNVHGWVKTYFEYDWKGAARAYKRGLELNPSSSEGHHNYSHYLMIMGRVEEGMASGRRASELSPFDRVNAGHHVWDLYIARRYEEALKHRRSILDADPENFFARNYAYLVYEQVRDYQRIIAEKPGLVSPTDLARAYALSGSEVEARRLLRGMLQNSDRLNAPFGIALVYLALRDKTSALDWLEQGYQRRVFPLPDISVDARFDPLRSEKRFQELLQRMGLDDRILRKSLRISTSARRNFQLIT
jgi:tetratricopeptide (TPR) repeat protein